MMHYLQKSNHLNPSYIVVKFSCASFTDSKPCYVAT